MNPTVLPIAAVVVSFQSAEVLPACLASLAAAGLEELVVVDNASSDGSQSTAADVPGVTLISNARNMGFAAAANQGIRVCRAPFVLLLNPDVVLESGLASLLGEMRNPSTGAAAGLLAGQDGKPQTGFLLRRFPTLASQTFEVLGINAVWPGNPVNRRYRCLELDPLAPQDAQQPPGAMLLIRRSAWEAIGGFDEAFFPAWFEDVDFCQRLIAAAYTIRYNPNCRARHLGAHSFRSLPWDSRQKYWYSNFLRHASKHFRIRDFRVLCAAVIAGALVRMVAESTSRFRLEAPPVFASVIARAFRSLVRGRLV